MAARLRLLIVEDQADMAFLVSESFRSEGYGVRVAKNGVEGLELARKHKPDLIITDVMMPLMDGHEMIGRLRLESRVPVIFLTAKNAEADSVRVKREGDEYMTKPFSMDALTSLVKNMLRNVAASSAGKPSPDRPCKPRKSRRPRTKDRDRYGPARRTDGPA